MMKPKIKKASGVWCVHLPKEFVTAKIEPTLQFQESVKEAIAFCHHLNGRKLAWMCHRDLIIEPSRVNQYRPGEL